MLLTRLSKRGWGVAECQLRTSPARVMDEGTLYINHIARPPLSALLKPAIPDARTLPGAPREGEGCVSRMEKWRALLAKYGCLLMTSRG